MCRSGRMSADSSPEGEDESIDLNKLPVERKRKKMERNVVGDGGWDQPDGVVKQGRVLRSRTVAMSDGEKQVIKMEIVSMEDKPANEASGLEDRDERVMIDPLSEIKILGKRGRPRKEDSKLEADPGPEAEAEASPLVHREKRKRGRPRKVMSDTEVAPILPRRKMKKNKRRGRPPTSDSRNDVSNINAPVNHKRGRPPKKQDKLVDSVLIFEDREVGQLDAYPKSNRICRDPGKLKWERQLGRPPKALKENVGSMTEDDDDEKCCDNRESAKTGPKKMFTRSSDTSQHGTMTGEPGRAKFAKQTNLRRNEEKQLLRDSILAMLKSAGWSVEYRRRQSKDYHDAVYVDREGKCYWSITLAYKKFKEKIDQGNANEEDILAFVRIPEETLSLLFRVDGRGKKAIKKSIKTTSGCTIGKQRTLLARRPKDVSDNDGFGVYHGKRSLLSWMIDHGTVPLSGKVKYMRGRCKKMLREGTIEQEGIRCDCCNILHTIKGFESHAGSIHGKPYENIYLDSGNSLYQCLVDSWKKHVEADDIGFTYVDVDGDDPNDDTCNVCGDGGDLICCDSCPSTFHHGCLHIDVPSGDWHCVYCSCKFCGRAEEPSDRNKLIGCHMCDEKFHVDCTIEMTAEEGSLSFCGEACYNISQKLKDLVGFRTELEEGFSYTVLQFRNFTPKVSLDGDISSLENNSKLAVAFTVMDECFQPITDERSGSSVIRNVVYSCGSNIRRLNFERFLTIILEKGDESVSAASIRIHGSPLAEMPFIGTRHIYRRQGMCSRLLGAIEKVLSSLGVEKLVIPAISELNDTWTNVFGFVPLEESKRLEMKYMSLIAFPGVDMLQKPIQSGQSMRGTPASDSNVHCNVQKEDAAEGRSPAEAPPYEEVDDDDDDMQTAVPPNSVARMDDAQCRRQPYADPRVSESAGCSAPSRWQPGDLIS